MVDERDRGKLMRRGRILSAPVATRVQLHNNTVSIAGTGSGPAVSARYNLLSNGRVTDQSATILEFWLLTGVAADYEVKASQISGDTITGTMDSWLALSGSPFWRINSAGPLREGSMSVQIRDAVTHAVLVGATIGLSADYGL